MAYEIGESADILDHGYIQLVDVMGSDEDICKAARVSYHEGSTTKVNEDRGLIDHLMRHRHTSPFEMGVMKFEIKLPIFVERQWVRHRTCSMNEMSARYSVLPQEFYIPSEEAVRAQSKTNKQGRAGVIDPAKVAWYRETLLKGCENQYSYYENYIEDEVAREIARSGLPVNIYTKKVWMMNVHNLLHFLKLRTDKHAQWEIRQYADVMEMFLAAHFPYTHASWENHVKYARVFSKDEWLMIEEALEMDKVSDIISDSRMSKTRKRELRQKLRLGQSELT